MATAGAVASAISGKKNSSIANCNPNCGARPKGSYTKPKVVEGAIVIRATTPVQHNGDTSTAKTVMPASAMRTKISAQQGQRRQHKDSKDASATMAKTPAKQ